MITLNRITHPDHHSFQPLIALYKEAFPPEERRTIEQLKNLLPTESRMYFNDVICDGELSGLFVYWKFDDFYFLEHLAVFATMRNKKIGQQVLTWVAQTLKGEQLLEVEPDNTEIAARRIMYYQRNGYFILDKAYRQPSYLNNGLEYPLWIMGNCPDSSGKQLQAKIQIIKDRVYYRK